MAHCPNCGAAMPAYTFGRPRRFCSRECYKAAARRVQKKRARAIRAGVDVVDNVDPLVVFERDGWACQSCGCATPRSAMGRALPRSPTIDHLIPLCELGPHSYANVRCLCHACNRAKARHEVSRANARRARRA